MRDPLEQNAIYLGSDNWGNKSEQGEEEDLGADSARYGLQDHVGVQLNPEGREETDPNHLGEPGRGEYPEGRAR